MHELSRTVGEKKWSEYLMRNFLFRGKKTTDGGWVCGGLLRDGDDAYIVKISDKGIPTGHIVPEVKIEAWQVKLETVGQFTGVRDRQGVDVYEGDIVDVCYHGNDTDEPCTGFVYFGGDDWLISFGNSLEECERFDDVEFLTDFVDGLRIMGNVYDDPELLESGKVE